MSTSIITNRMHAGFAGLVLAASLVGAGQRCLAQTGSLRPDALVIVQPVGDHAMVTVSFSGKVPHAKAKQTLIDLAKRGGWSLSGTDVSDVDLKSTDKYGPAVKLGIQTGATAVISGAPLASKGGFILQPFIDSLQDLKSYKLLYWVAPQPDFMGLRRFESPEVSVELVQDGGPYRYAIVNQQHHGPMPRLPLTQAPPSNIATLDNAKAKPSAGVWSSIAPIVGISVGAGIVVFAVLRMLAATRNRSRNQRRSGRTFSRDSRNTSRI